MSEQHPPQAHTGLFKNPKQILIAGVLAFVVPIFTIIVLATFVSSGNRLSEGSANPERGVELRIQKVGTVEIRDANRPLKSGEEVYKAQCVACHGTGAAGAPKFQDTAAWAPRIKTGYEALLHSSLAGKGAMAPQGGGDFNDTEIGRAVVFLANAGGAKFDEPAAPSAEASDDAGTVLAPQAAAPVAAPTAPTSPAEPAAGEFSATPEATPAPPAAAETATVAAASGVGESLYKQACQVCHAAGVAGAPKLGDKAAWAPRLATGMDTLYKAAINGMGAMPPRGGSSASDADIHAAVDYMTASVK